MQIQIGEISTILRPSPAPAPNPLHTYGINQGPAQTSVITFCAAPVDICMKAAYEIMNLPSKKLTNYRQSPNTKTSQSLHPALDAVTDIERSKYFPVKFNFRQAIRGEKNCWPSFWQMTEYDYIAV